MHTDRRTRGRRAAAAGVGLVATAGMALAGVSLADTQRVDGDLAANNQQIFYQRDGSAGNKRDCADRGESVAGQVTVSYNGNDHFPAGTPISLKITGNDAASSASGITITAGAGSTPTPWNGSSPTASVPFTTTVPAGLADGVYKFDIQASAGGVDAKGSSQLIVHVQCTSDPAPNGAPVVSAITGKASVNEGDLESYSVTASDPDNDPLTYAWSITSGAAQIDGPADGSSVSVKFNDGQSTVALQVDVSDGVNPPVTKYLSIDEANVAPTTTFTGTPATSVNEGDTKTYTYTVTDPGDDTTTTETSCGGNGTKSNDVAGSFDCTFPDGTASSTVSAQSTDSDLATGNKATVAVSIANVTPLLSNLVLDAPALACVGGTTVKATYAFADPGADNPWTPSVNWGDAGTTDVTYPTVSAPGTVGPLSHTYLGTGSFTVTAKVTDDEATGTLASATNAVKLFYSTGQGILQPINYTGPRSAFKIGSTIPVKVKITDCNGAAVSTLKPTVTFKKIDSTVDPAAQDEAATSTVPDQGNVMRFTGTPDLQYIFNLATKSFTVGTYQVTVSDPSIAPISALVDVKK